jgi:hypothetical protein
MPGPTCQSQAPLKRRPETGVARVWQLLGRCHHLAPALSTGCHVRSTRDACSRRPVRQLVALSVRKRSCFLSSHSSRRMPTHITLPLTVHLCSFIIVLPYPKHRPLRTTLMLPCSNRRPLRQAGRWATIYCKEPLRPPPSCAEAAFPSSATSDHRHAPPSRQRSPLELTTAPWTPSWHPPPLLWPAIACSPLLTCFAAVSPPQWAPPPPVLQIGTLTSRASSLAPPSPANRSRSAGFGRSVTRQWGLGGAPLFQPSGPKGPSGPSHFHRLGQAPPWPSPIAIVPFSLYPSNYSKFNSNLV